MLWVAMMRSRIERIGIGGDTIAATEVLGGVAFVD
jgi:hypothetical protein